MSSSTISTAGLAQVHDAMARVVERGDVPGLVTLVAHGDEAHVDAIGTLRMGEPAPMPRDAVFRIASLTKPVTAVAALQLVEDGVLALDAPIDEWLPELADRRVLRAPDAALDDTVPAARAITVEDLLTFRTGIGLVLAPPGTLPIQQAEIALDLRTFGPPWPPTSHTPDSWIAALGTLPLVHQPGTQWMYNTSGSVLGVLVERAAGRPLGDVFAARIFEPLGMRDTGFAFRPDQRGRVTTSYTTDDTGAMAVRDTPDGWWSAPPSFPDGSAWLVSTIDDYWAFVRTLRAGGPPLLRPETVERMLSDQLTDEQRVASGPFFADGQSWGLGLAVPARGTRTRSIAAGYGWDGGSGTSWRTDPARDLTAIVFTQREMTSPEPPATFTELWKVVETLVA